MRISPVSCRKDWMNGSAKQNNYRHVFERAEIMLNSSGLVKAGALLFTYISFISAAMTISYHGYHVQNETVYAVYEKYCEDIWQVKPVRVDI